MNLTDNERIECTAKLEVYERMLLKGDDIKTSKITAAYFCQEIKREIALLKEDLRVVKPKAAKIEVITPEYGPGDEVRHTMSDTPALFTVMEVNHGTKEYKLTSNNLIKVVTVIVGWGELDESL
jgi:hypothetical protein